MSDNESNSSLRCLNKANLRKRSSSTFSMMKNTSSSSKYMEKSTNIFSLNLGLIHETSQMFLRMKRGNSTFQSKSEQKSWIDKQNPNSVSLTLMCLKISECSGTATLKSSMRSSQVFRSISFHSCTNSGWSKRSFIFTKSMKTEYSFLWLGFSLAPTSSTICIKGSSDITRM